MGLDRGDDVRWRRRTEQARRQVPDRLRIAELEWELFGIQPTPGTAAAAAVGMRHLSRALKGGHASTDATVHDVPPLPESLARRPD
jgi:hypothetical protein